MAPQKQPLHNKIQNGNNLRTHFTYNIFPHIQTIHTKAEITTHHLAL
jgi:hypothetical protein